MNHNVRSLLGTVLLSVLCLCGRAAGQSNLPDGKGKAEFIHNCTACHRSEMVVRVKKTPDEWRKSVDDMAARGTDGTKEDLDNAYLYLVTFFAKDASESAPATPSTMSSGMPSDSAMLHYSDLERLRRAGESAANLKQQSRQLATKKSVSTAFPENQGWSPEPKDLARYLASMPMTQDGLNR